MVDDFNLTHDPTALGHCIPRLLEKSVTSYSSKTALISADTELTFDEFNARANRFARHLVGQGLGRGDLVGVVLNRTVDLVVVLLAVLKSGAAYIPIDPTLPTERIRQMMDDAGPKLGVASTDTRSALSCWQGSCLSIDEVQDHPNAESSNLDVDIHPDDLAYVLFTSGSTGRPKGVQVVHGAVTNFLLSMKREPGCVDTDRLLAVSTISFDTAVLELFLPVLSGGTTVIAQTHEFKDAAALVGLMEKHSITMMIATPTIWRILLDFGWQGKPRLRKLLCGGEAMHPRLGERLLGCSDRVWNMYGPTETTVISSCWRVCQGEDVVIGKPLANIQYYVLDTDMSPVPMGTAGELYIGGACLARGYLNNPELTKARFVKTPVHDGLLYRTGDLACFRAPGKLSVLGRNDGQVKIRGYRIELGEIEGAILDHKDISSAVVISRDERLVAYCVRQRPQEVDGDTTRCVDHVNTTSPNSESTALGPLLRTWVAERLPSYMVPAFFVEIDELPLSPTGKIDVKSLPDPTAEVEVAAMPTTEFERLILGIWSEVLGHDRIGVEDNFFQVGGDSLRIIRVQRKLSELLGQQVSAAKLFEYYTIRALATHLASKEETKPESVPAQPHMADTHEDIAIVSMSCRLPGGVTTPEEYWELLASGHDATCEVPKDRWDADAFYDSDPDAPGKTYCRRGGFLSSIESFDASFFGITPREARALDPTHHLMLETCWEGFERAGYTMNQLRGSQTGVFIGTSNNPVHHGCIHAPSVTDLNGAACTGVSGSAISGRVSYILGLNGPAMTIETACSASLVTTHLACTALRQGECDMAISGGAALMLTPGLQIEFSRLGGLSPDGRCRSFAADTQGTSFSEGATAVVLKRLSDAQRDGDTIHAVLRGTAVNHDGRSAGLTTPSGSAQQQLIRRALAVSGLGPGDIDYIEAHGTATKLGDPIEGEALAEVFGSSRSGTENPLWVGSAKSNLGHTQAAAGVAGLMKVVLSLQHSTLPETLHVVEPTPAVDWKGANMAPVQEKQPWLSRRPRRAGVSAFGLGGTNAHVIIEEAPNQVVESKPASAPLPPTVPLLLSGFSDAALRQQALKLQLHLGSKSDSLGDVAYSLAMTRNHFRRRLVLMAKDKAETLDKLKAVSAQGTTPPSDHTQEPRLAMLFTGQGSQLPGMGRGLAQHYPVFREALEDIAAQFADFLEKPLLDVMWSSESETAALLQRTDYAQPALFSLEVALWRLWDSWRVRPDIVLGHSIGELAATHIAGIMNLPDACRLVAARGRLMQNLPSGGGMVSLEVNATEAAVAIEMLGLGGKARIAAHNTPTQTVASGDMDALETLKAHFAAQGRKFKMLEVSHAFHSHHMDSILPAFQAVAETVLFKPPTLAMVSTLTGKLVEAGELQWPTYWVQQVRNSVRFSDGIECLASRGVNTFLELGPRPVLCGMGATTLADDTRMSSTAWLPSLVPRKEDTTVIQGSLSELHVRHVPVDWSNYFKPFGCQRVELPTYAFQRERFQLNHNGFQLQDSGSSHNNTTNGEVHGVDSFGFEIGWDRVNTGEQGLSSNDLSGRVWGLSLPAGDVPWASDVTAAFSRADIKLLPVSHLKDAEGLDGLLCLWDSSANVLHQAQESMAKALEQLQAAARTEFVPTLVWITRNAVGAGANDSARGLGEAALWGLMRTARNEHPELRLHLIDLDENGATSLDALVPTLVLGTEPEYAVRRGQLFVPQMQRAEASVPKPAGQRPLVRQDGAVLITGGLGEIGQHVARWLARVHGIRDVVLTSRHGMKAPGAETLVAELSQLGAKATVVASNIADLDSVQGLMAMFDIDNRPLRGVVHAAGTLDDGVLSALTAERCNTTFGPKAAGAWHLHQLTRDVDLDLFIVLSSISGVMGNAGQGNYAAANTFLDALMQLRRAERLPATSVALGLWGGEGMGGRLSKMDRARYAQLGLNPLEPEDGLYLFEQAARSGRAMTVVAAYDLERLRNYHEDRGGIPPVLGSLLGHDRRQDQPKSSGARDLREALGEASQHGQQHDAVALSMVQDTVAKTLGFTSSADLDVDLPLRDVGVDSLTAVLIRNQLAILTGLSLTARIVFDHANLRALGQHLLSEVRRSWEDSSSEGENSNIETPDTAISEDSLLNMPALRKGCLDPSFTFSTPGAATEFPEDVFVTGATGFVGAYVVSEMLQLGITTHCLVRAGSVEQARKRLVDTLASYGLWHYDYMRLLVPVVGDMSQPLFGLKEETFEQLADQIDAICHSGSLVDWMRPLEDYVGPNIVSAHEVLRLASRGRGKAVHLISTMSTVPKYLGYDVTESEVEYGYATSKYLAEQMVAAARWRGARASIYRLPFVTASSSTGHFRLDRGDFLHNLIAGCVELDSYPFIDADLSSILPVDYLSRTVASIMTRHQSRIGQDFDFNNAQAPSFSRFFALMGAEEKTILFSKWQQQAMAHGAEHPTSPLARIATMLDGCTDDNAPLLFKGPPLGKCILGGDDYPVPPVDENCVRKYLDRIRLAQEERSRCNGVASTS